MRYVWSLLATGYILIIILYNVLIFMKIYYQTLSWKNATDDSTGFCTHPTINDFQELKKNIRYSGSHPSAHTIVDFNIEYYFTDCPRWFEGASWIGLGRRALWIHAVLWQQAGDGRIQVAVHLFIRRTNSWTKRITVVNAMQNQLNVPMVKM